MADSEFKVLVGTIVDVSDLKRQIDGVKADSIKINVDTKNAINKINSLEKKIKSLSKIKVDIGGASTSSVGKTINNINRQIDAATKKINNLTYKNERSKINDVYGNLSYKTEEATKSLREYNRAYSELMSSMKSGVADKQISAINKYNEAHKKIQNELRMTVREQKNASNAIKQYNAEIKQFNRDVTNEYERMKTALRMDKWLTDNSAAIEMYGDEIDNLKRRLRDADSVELGNIKKEFDIVTLKAGIAGKTGLNFSDRLKMQFNRLGAYFGASGVIMGGIEASRMMFQSVLDVDTAMTELYRVTDLSSAQYTSLYNDMTASAKEYGVVLSDLISSTADWTRAGFSPDVAKDIAETTAIYQHIADLDYDTAVENLLTAYKGFQEQLTKQFAGDDAAAVAYIGDILNELDNNYSVTAAGLGEGIKRSASALAVAGNTLEETAAMIGGITEVTQDPAKAGNALKTVSMRIRGMKGELEQMGEESDEYVENISKMQGQIYNLTRGKVNIFDNTGEFKSTYEIFRDIAGVWEELSSIEQADLLETVAGKHRANDVAAMISNWENVENMLVSAQNSEGSAIKEHEKYVNSLQGKLNTLQSAWQQFSNTFMSSDFLKGGVDVITSIVTAFESLIKTLGVLGTVGAGLGIFGYARGGGFSKLFGGIKGMADGSISSFSVLRKEVGLTKSSFLNFAGSLSGILGIGGVVIGVVSGIVTAIQNYKEEQQRLRQETIDTGNSVLQSVSGFEQAYVKYADKTMLTTEEEQELNSAVDATISALGEKGDALAAAAASADGYANSLDRLAEAEIKEAQIAAKDALEAAKGEVSEAVKQGGGLLLPKDDSKTYDVINDILGDSYGDFKKLKVDSSFQGQTSVSSYLAPPDAEDINAVTEYYYLMIRLRDALSDADMADTAQYESISSEIQKYEEPVKQYIDQLYKAEEANYKLANGIPKTIEEYYAMKDAVLSTVDAGVEAKMAIATAMDTQWGEVFDIGGIENTINTLKSIVPDLSGEDSKRLETFLDIRTQLNSGDVSIGEYMSSLDKIESMISQYDESTQDAIIKTLGIDFDNDSVKRNYEELINGIVRTGVSGQTASALADQLSDTLTESELEAAVELVSAGKIKLEDIDVSEIEKAIEEYARYKEAMQFEINIESETTGIETFNSALAETRSATGLTQESIDALSSRYKILGSEFDASKLFQETAVGIRLNAEELNNLEQSYADMSLDKIDDNLSVLSDKYNDLGVQIENCSDINERANLYAEREDVRAKINELGEQAAAYKGLTSAYAEWQNAQSAGSDRDMYNNVFSEMENIKKELDLGWIDDATMEYFQLIWGEENWSGAGKSIEDYRNKWSTLDNTIKGTSYSIQDFFKTNADGELTSEGIFNFFDAVKQKQEELGKDWVQTDKDGNVVSFDFGVNGDKAIADALGISEELVQIMIDASQDAGFVVTIDGKYTQFADLKNNAEEAAEKLRELDKTDVAFDFDTTSVDSVKEQITEAKRILDEFKNEDGTIKSEFINSDGSFTEDAQAAIDVMSTLTAMADKLSEPVYMQLEANQVEESMQEPLKDLQKFESLVKEKHQLEITGADTSELDKEMDSIAEKLASDSEWKAKVGIDTDATAEDIKKMAEAGEIEIPANVDIQLEMDDKLNDIRLLMMNQAGLISDEELKLAFTLDTTNVDDYTPEEKEAIVNFFADTEDVDNYTPEQKQAIAKYIKDIDDIENWSPEDKKAVCDFIVNNEDVMSYTPEEKSAIAKYIADPSDVDSFTPEDKQAIARFVAEHGDVDAWNPEDRKAIAKFLKDSVDVDSYQPDDKEAVATYRPDTSAVNSWSPPTKFGTAIYNVVTSGMEKLKSTVTGIVGVNGTANVNGTAFAKGSWSTNDSGTALVGELGQETIVRNGRYFTVGDNGAEFIKYQRGDIIFNHKQTEELFKNGVVTSGGGRGKAYASGTAFSSGTGANNPWKGSSFSGSSSSSSSSSSKKSSSKSSSSSKASDDAKEFSETLDWIEIAIDRIERAIDRLDITASSAFKSWSSRSSALSSQISKTRDEIELQQKAYDRYLKEANSVGLSSSWAKKVRDGKVDIETIGDEDLAEKIKEYQDWYEKALDAKDAIEELKQAEAELYKQRFDNVSTKFDGIISVIQHEKDMLDEFVTQDETKGYVVSGEYYKAMIDNQKKQKSELEKQKKELLAEFQKGMESGTITKGSEAWYEMVNSVDEVTKAIAEADTAILEFENSIRELDWSVFDMIQERISNVSSEADFLIDLMSNKKLYEDNGQLTDEGMATMGLHGLNYNVYMNQSDRYNEEIKKLDEQIAKDPYDQELIDRRQELLELQQESILAAEDEKNAIKDMVEEGIKMELDSLQELIDKRNEALDAQKDMYDYQKKVAEQTKEISELEKQMAAYAGDDSEESQAKIQEIKTSLEEARQNLEETEYDKYISDQQKLLDELYTEYETILNARLDNIDALLSDMITEINTNAGTINDTLTQKADEVGYTLSESMKSIWDTSSSSITNGITTVITKYGDGFTTSLTTTNATLNTISINIANMITQLNKLAKTNIKAAGTSSAANSSQANAKPKPSGGGSSSSSKPSTSKGDGTPRVGDKVLFVSGSYFYDSYGTRPTGSKNHGKYVYITNINKKGSYPYHISTGSKLGSGDLGWLKLNQISGYATGKRIMPTDETSWTQENGAEMIVRPSDGAILTPLAKGDSVLTSEASGNIWDMANDPSEFIKSNLGLGSVDTNIARGSSANCTQNFENIVFNMPNVKNYEQMLKSMQKDKNFERLVMAMTIDKVAGKSSLAKGKSIR